MRLVLTEEQTAELLARLEAAEKEIDDIVTDAADDAVAEIDQALAGALRGLRT